MQEIDAVLKVEGLDLQIEYHNIRSLWPEDGVESESTDASSSVYVDDAVFTITASGSQYIVFRTQRAMQIIAKVFRSHGLHLDFKRAKTECLLIIRGAGSKAVKKAVFVDDDSSISFIALDGSRCSVGVVDRYTHVGSVVTSTRNMLPDVRARARMCGDARRPLARKVFRACDVSREVKLDLASSLCVTRLLFNAVIWDPLCAPAAAALHAAYMQVFRSVTGMWRVHAADRVSDAQVLSQLLQLSVSHNVRVLRLCYFHRLLNFALKGS